MKKKIRINPLDPQSIQHAMTELKAYKEWVNKKTSEFLYRLALVAKSEIENAFATTGYLGTYPTVSIEATEKGFRVIAEGESVAFIEFGTGIYAGQGVGFHNIPFSTEPGSWSQSEEGMGNFIPGVHEYWHYGGQVVEGSMPANGFYKAYTSIEREAPRIAKEVFG